MENDGRQGRRMILFLHVVPGMKRVCTASTERLIVHILVVATLRTGPPVAVLGFSVI